MGVCSTVFKETDGFTSLSCLRIITDVGYFCLVFEEAEICFLLHDLFVLKL